MKLFVWNRAEHASQSYHDDGGIVVIADTLDRARSLIAETCKGYNDEPCSALTNEPDLARKCDGPEFIAVHPDAGCC